MGFLDSTYLRTRFPTPIRQTLTGVPASLWRGGSRQEGHLVLGDFNTPPTFLPPEFLKAGEAKTRLDSAPLMCASDLATAFLLRTLEDPLQELSQPTSATQQIVILLRSEVLEED